MLFQRTVNGVNGNSRKEDATASRFGAQIRLDFWHKKQTIVLRKKIIEFARKAEWNILITIFPSALWLLVV